MLTVVEALWTSPGVSLHSCDCQTDVSMIPFSTVTAARCGGFWTFSVTLTWPPSPGLWAKVMSNDFSDVLAAAFSGVCCLVLPTSPNL